MDFLPIFNTATSVTLLAMRVHQQEERLAGVTGFDHRQR